MKKLSGKVAVVTGASKGIGAAIAKSLAAEGASVVVNYASSRAGADAVVGAITSAGGKAVAVAGDVSKGAEAKGLVDAAVKNFGRLDILVNNSGVYAMAPLDDITEDQFHRMFNINVLGVLLTTRDDKRLRQKLLDALSAPERLPVFCWQAVLVACFDELAQLVISL